MSDQGRNTNRLDLVRIATSKYGPKAEARWRDRAGSGLSDAGIDRAIHAELGEAGGFICQGIGWVEYRGGAHPMIKIVEWADRSEANESHTGATLRALVREAWGIGSADGQLALEMSYVE